MIKLKNILSEIDSLGYIDWGDPVASRQRRGEDPDIGEEDNDSKKLITLIRSSALILPRGPAL